MTRRNPFERYFWRNPVSVIAIILKVACAKDTCHGNPGEESCLTAAEQCTLWLAKSTIPGAGLGIFTAIEREEGDVIGNGEVIVPIIDYDYHLSALGIQDWPGNPNFVYDYIWWGLEFGLHYESATPFYENFVFSPGLDAAINCDLALLNTEKTAAQYDPLDLHRASDPGVGAFTPYHNNRNYATHYIPAGGELFKNYGNSYFTERYEIFGEFPLREDHPRAESLLGKFGQMLEKFPQLSRDTVDDAWRLITEFPIRSRLLNAVPKDVSVAQNIASEGRRYALTELATRDIEELQQTGRCLDAIEHHPSALKQAGRGAFVKAFYAAGSIITGSPLMLIPTSDFFNMYEGDWFEKHDKPDIHERTNLQLLINYCFHHPDSSVYLLPYGGGVNYINHNKTMANVRIVWTKNGEMGHSDSVLETNLENLKYKVAPGLFIDYIATRDIQPGEELFLDYGDEWEEAWNDHVGQWNSHGQYHEDYRTGAEWNLILEHDFVRTVREQVQNPYPENIMTHCFSEDIFPEDNTPRSIIEYVWEAETTYTLPCMILDRYKVEDDDNEDDGDDDDDGEMLYTVAYKLARYGDDDRDQWKVYEGLPRNAIRFVDVPYSTDMMLPDAFRHPIGWPDQIFPDKWRGKFLTLP